MLEVIGLIVWVLITVGLTATPFLIVAISSLGGGLPRTERFFILALLSLAAYSWYEIFQSIDVNFT